MKPTAAAGSRRGDYVLMVVFGGGLTWASTVVEW